MWIAPAEFRLPSLIVTVIFLLCLFTPVQVLKDLTSFSFFPVHTSIRKATFSNVFRFSLCTQWCNNRKIRTLVRTAVPEVSLQWQKTKSAEGSKKITLQGLKIQSKTQWFLFSSEEQRKWGPPLLGSDLEIFCCLVPSRPESFQQINNTF